MLRQLKRRCKRWRSYTLVCALAGCVIALVLASDYLLRIRAPSPAAGETASAQRPALAPVPVPRISSPPSAPAPHSSAPAPSARRSPPPRSPPPSPPPRKRPCFSKAEDFVPYGVRGRFISTPDDWYEDVARCTQCLCREETRTPGLCESACARNTSSTTDDAAGINRAVRLSGRHAVDWHALTHCSFFTRPSHWEYGCALLLQSERFTRSTEYCVDKLTQLAYLRWESAECDLDLFDEHAFMERFAGRTLVLAGDSVMRQSFMHLMCLLLNSSRVLAADALLWSHAQANPFSSVMTRSHFEFACAVFDNSFVLVFCAQGPHAELFEMCMSRSCLSVPHVENIAPDVVVPALQDQLIGVHNTSERRAQVLAAITRGSVADDAIFNNWGIRTAPADNLASMLAGADGKHSTLYEMAERTPLATVTYRGCALYHPYGGEPGKLEACAPSMPVLDATAQHDAITNTSWTRVEYAHLMPNGALHHDNGKGLFFPVEEYFREVGSLHTGNSYKGDCIHYCMPGPTDLVDRMMVQRLLSDARPRRPGP